MTMKKLILATLLSSTALLATGLVYAAPLYFPHVATNFPWQTEIAIINTSANQVTGTLRGLSDGGQLIETKNVTLAARGRRQIIIADEFTNHADIGYIIFDTNSAAVRGYTKFYQAGSHRAAIPAVKEVNTSDIYISHIASNADWWTGVSLVNTTSATKVLTITFNNGQSFPYPLNANEHRIFEIADEFFNNQPRPDIESAVITNASGVIGLELFGSKGGATHMDGILLTGTTTSTIYYPHVASNDYWWTGIVAYNPSSSQCTITITPYSAQGTLLSSSTLPIPGKGKYIGPVSALGLPAQTAWFKIDSTSPITGFELFGTTDGNQLAAYAGGGEAGKKAGVFAKIEKDGWTGIAFVNTEGTGASVNLYAYKDDGTLVATQVLPVPGYAKVVNNPQPIFSQDISSATYITYSSDKSVIGFQLNASSDGTMLDALPGLAGAVPDPLNNLLEMRSVKINLTGLRPDGTSRSIQVEIDAIGNMHLRYTLPGINAENLPEGTDLSGAPSGYEIYVIDGKAYAPSESDPTWVTNPVDSDYAPVLKSQMHGLEGFTTWLDILPTGSLQAAGNETLGGFSTDKYTVIGMVDGQQITGMLWYDPQTHSLVKADLHIPAILNSDPANPESGEFLITLVAEKAEIQPVTLPSK
jgi:hypothetical protein